MAVIGVRGPGLAARPGGLPGVSRPDGRGRLLLTVAVGFALTLVILAPALLSSSDLLRWASSEDGLGLPTWWAWLAFVALDAAAVVCVGMVTLCAWRGEAGGMFEVLTWVFALGSAWANHRHGLTTEARDDEFFFPAMSLAGPLLLHVTLSRMRRWYRVDTGRQAVARPRFGLRWLPGVAFRQTLRAWQTAVREGLDRPDVAVGQVREREMLRRLSAPEQVQLAFQALGRTDLHAARSWLAARGVFVAQDDVTAALGAERPVAVEVAVEPGRPAPEVPLNLPREVGGVDGPSPGGPRRGLVGAGDMPAVVPAVVPAVASAGASMPAADDPAPMEVWQRRRLDVAVTLLSAQPDLSLPALATGLQAHGHEVTERVAARIHAEAVEFLRAETGYAS